MWLSDSPLDENEGASGDIVLEVTIDLPESKVAQYEWVEEGKGYREFLVPAELINATSSVRIIEDDSVIPPGVQEFCWAEVSDGQVCGKPAIRYGREGYPVCEDHA